MMKVILASQNAHKAEEMAASMPGFEISAAPYAIEVDEDCPDFMGNASKKARAYAEAFGGHVLADDSGLSVLALEGAPGVHSARFAVIGPDVDPDPDRTAANNRKLLRLMTGVENREAYFTCALSFISRDHEMIQKLKGYQAPEHVSLRFWDHDGQICDLNSDHILEAEILFEARSYGCILCEARGGGGFGYDPLFYCPETDCTFAELSKTQKLAVSHRGRALKQLREIFASLGALI